MEARCLVAAEMLPCPACRAVTRALLAMQGIEVVRCSGCGRLLRRRPALTVEQRAQALVLRWAAAQLEQNPNVRRMQRRRKLRGDPDEHWAMGMARAAEELRQWARTIHKRPPIAEDDGVALEGRLPSG